MSEQIVNRVANSGIMQLDLAELFPVSQLADYDIANNLFEGLILREKDFRQFVKDYDWSVFNNKYVRLHCTANAIVPTWAYMLMVSEMKPYAKKVVYGSEEMLFTAIWIDVIENMDMSNYNDARVVVKGCSTIPIPETAFTLLSQKLIYYVKSLMFVEPCSTVPIYKKQ